MVPASPAFAGFALNDMLDFFVLAHYNVYTSIYASFSVKNYCKNRERYILPYIDGLMELFSSSPPQKGILSDGELLGGLTRGNFPLFPVGLQLPELPWHLLSWPTELHTAPPGRSDAFLLPLVYVLALGLGHI